MKLLKKFVILGAVTLGFSVPFLAEIPVSIAQSRSATVYAPPSNVRSYPNGPIVCTIRNVTTIEILSNNNGWYETYACGSRGYIHNSQIRIQNNYNTYEGNPNPNCVVVGIRSGQLALRNSPNGPAFAGLNNGNVVKYIQGDHPWYKVRVLQGPNSQVNNRIGWVNANYLECAWD